MHRLHLPKITTQLLESHGKLQARLLLELSTTAEFHLQSQIPHAPAALCTQRRAKWRTCGEHHGDEVEEEDAEEDEHAPIRSASHFIASTSVRMSIKQFKQVRQTRPGIWAVQFPVPAVAPNPPRPPAQLYTTTSGLYTTVHYIRPDWISEQSRGHPRLCRTKMVSAMEPPLPPRNTPLS
ncbi:hypothetical protein DHEL01_v202532 [Diaporthe helianthi]|uniref:Uncharacterized protein n=1 Tax=Diaporthe helianthi TaxID=158607 RepID=A0A2P5I992_DIAHE|nr:hypothetical protein DHEL01_v202532 [Diaporthe helianthi]